jgi:hypothetical protein
MWCLLTGVMTPPPLKVGTNTAEKVVYMGVEQKPLLQQWMSVINSWLTFYEFFKPKAIKERGVALSSILSGQVRPNTKSSGSMTGSRGGAASSDSLNRDTGDTDDAPLVASVPGEQL